MQPKRTFRLRRARRELGRPRCWWLSTKAPQRPSLGPVAHLCWAVVGSRAACLAAHRGSTLLSLAPPRQRIWLQDLQTRTPTPWETLPRGPFSDSSHWEFRDKTGTEEEKRK